MKLFICKSFEMATSSLSSQDCRLNIVKNNKTKILDIFFIKQGFQSGINVKIVPLVLTIINVQFFYNIFLSLLCNKNNTASS